MNRWVGLTLIILLPLLGGCSGNKNGTVSGKVTVAEKGELKGGTITFVSVADTTKTASGEIQPNGVYTVENVPLGDCKVVINTDAVRGRDPTLTQKGAPKGKAPPSVGPPDSGIRYMPIEAKVEYAQTTDLRATVAKGKNQKDFEVKGR